MKSSNKLNKYSARLTAYLLNLVYPWRCQICAANTLDKSVCSQCEDYLPWCDGCSKCALCALPLVGNESKQHICGMCQKHTPSYDQLNSVFWYQEPIDQLITDYKYFNCWDCARTLTELCKSSFDQHCTSSVIIPMPSHPMRVRQRGFNAVYELMKFFTQNQTINIDHQAVERIKNTESQTGKSKAKRRKNVTHAFQVIKPLKGQHYTIVDEVVTTGATVNELSKCLKRAGASKVSVWAIARTRNKYFR